MASKIIKKNKFQIVLIAGLLSGIILLLSLTPLGVTAQAPPAPTPPGGSFDQRLAQRKAERNVTLDEKTQKRVQSFCIKGQGEIRKLQQKTSPALTERTKIYQRMDAKLWVMIGKLKLAEKDTFTLEKQRSAFAEKTAKFQATAQLYQQSLDDLGVVNCQADPAGFRALLDTARIYRTQLRDQSTDLRNYVINDIKTTLGSFASDLQAKPAIEESN